MKKSYWVYSGILLFLVLVMIVGGVIQDHRTKKVKLRKAVTRTMTQTGCIEIEDDEEIPVPSDDELLHGGDDVDLSALSEAQEMIPQLEDYGVDGQALFTTVGQKILSGARFEITKTDIHGRDAEVNVHIYYANHEGDVVLEYFYYQDEWVLSNTVEALKKLTIDGRDYDEAEASAFEVVMSAF
ncbi:MAG: hypothetical protein J5636_02425 [Clostridiales bacterium]|nr:hypothetical protein [Clostridiales bacterium]